MVTKKHRCVTIFGSSIKPWPTVSLWVQDQSIMKHTHLNSREQLGPMRPFKDSVKISESSGRDRKLATRTSPWITLFLWVRTRATAICRGYAGGRKQAVWQWWAERGWWMNIRSSAAKTKTKKEDSGVFLTMSHWCCNNNNICFYTLIEHNINLLLLFLFFTIPTIINTQLNI